MRIDDGEFVFLVGPSGSGKSTVIKLITAEIAPTEGRVMVNGYNLNTITPRQVPLMRRTLGIIFQDFRLYLQDRKLSDNTIASYLGSLRLYKSLYPTLTAANVRKYRSYLIKHFRPATVNQRLCGFNHYLDSLGKPEYKQPAVRLQTASYLDAVISNKRLSVSEKKN